MVFEHIGREMSRTEVDDFLREMGHGLLSLADGDVAYGVPMSYGYDPETGVFALEFLFQGESRKREFVAATREASLCVYTWEGPETWWSVVASGTLERVDDEDRIGELASLLAAGASDVAPWWLRTSFSRDRDRAWYALDAESVTGYCAE